MQNQRLYLKILKTLILLILGLHSLKIPLVQLAKILTKKLETLISNR
jgi:hypothetical protein